jgi:hypothetical protein
MTAVAPSISKYSEIGENAPPKSAILNQGGSNNTDSTIDLGKVDQYQNNQPKKRVSATSKDESKEDSSVHARDTDDILKFSQNDTRELFDVDNDLGNITELCDAEELTFQRELKSGTFQSTKAKKMAPKHKTDGFLVSNLEAEDDEELIANMELKKRPERGGSHNFNIYSERKDKQGDFDLNKISEVDIINEES